MSAEPGASDRRADARAVELGRSVRLTRAALARARQRQTGPAGWIQVNVALFLQRPGLPPFVPWASLLEALEAWRAAGRFEGCFWVRKEPGLRLRFWGDNLAARLEPELLIWLRAAEQKDQIRAFRLSIYEPEEHLFGGPVGMALAHRQFDRDARIVLRYLTLPPADREPLTYHLFSLALLNDLFGRAVDDLGEMWDVWQRLRIARDVLPLPETISDAELKQAQAISEQERSFVASLPPSLQQLLREGRAANREIATALRAASSAGRVQIGLRAWLMAVSIFNWNRLGLDPEDQIQLIAWMLRLLDPHAQTG